MLKGKIRIFVCVVPAIIVMIGILAHTAIYLIKPGKVCTPELNACAEIGCANLPEQNKAYPPDKPLKSEIIKKAKSIQMPFVANEGQMDEQVRFYAKTFGGTVFVTKTGEIIYSLPMNDCESGIENTEKQGEGSGNEARNSETESRNQKLNPKSNTTGIVLKEEIVGAQIKTVQGEQLSVTKVNYLKGNDPSQWKTNICTYNEVNLGEVYEGIELRLRAYGNNVEKLFCIKPGARPDQISVHLNGVKYIKVNEEGLLEVDTELGHVSFTKPIAYQEVDGKRVDVGAEYVIRDQCPLSVTNKEMDTDARHSFRTYSFNVAAYDKTKELVIDPLLASTFLGGAADDKAQYIAIDAGGDVFVTGHTLSSDFPTTLGAYGTSSSGSIDAFVSKINGDLTSLLASTYLGGSDSDDAWSITIDSGNLFVTGYTNSSNFPTTPGAYGTSSSGSKDVFISKLNGDLTNLLASTYLGGSNGDDWPWSIVIDSGNVFVDGYTSSSDFPTTPGAYDTSYNSGEDIFISKLNGDLTSLLASTFLGGSGTDHGHAIAIDSGDIFVTGYTGSSDFPTTPGAYDTSYNSGEDIFISKLNGDLTSLLASTFLGGSARDVAGGIAIELNDVFVSGFTGSSDFPTTPGAYDTSYNGSEDVFVSKLNSDLTSLLASTYLGGSDSDEANSWSIAINSGNLFVASSTYSSDFPTTPDAYDTSYNGGEDVFVSKLNGDLTSLLASTFLGGSGTDRAYSIAINSGGNVFITGYTWSFSASNFPVTLGAYDTSFNGSSVLSDVFISKFDNDLSASPTAIELTSFTASTDDNSTVNLIWETATEVDNAGFNIYRAKSKDGRYKKINDELIGAKGDAVAGATYNFMDTPGRGTFYYKLEDIDYSGATTMHGPIKMRIKSITD